MVIYSLKLELKPRKVKPLIYTTFKKFVFVPREITQLAVKRAIFLSIKIYRGSLKTLVTPTSKITITCVICVCKASPPGYFSYL